MEGKEGREGKCSCLQLNNTLINVTNLCQLLFFFSLKLNKLKTEKQQYIK